MRRTLVLSLFAAALATAAAVAQSSTGVLELISVSSSGEKGNADSGTSGFTTPSGARAAVTPDGRFVAFMSFATNLVPEDTNESADVFVRDRLTGITERVSVTSKGVQGNNHSGITSSKVGISDDGRFVAFDSEATNLARGDSNANAEVFVHDRQTRVTELITVGIDGDPGTGSSPSISGDGRFVAFISGGQTLVPGHPEFETRPHAYVYDRQTGTMERVDVTTSGDLASGQTNRVAISGDGRFIAFDTFADNLTAPGDQEGVDVFVRDRVNGITEGISTVGDTGGFEGNTSLSSITADGRFVGFTSPDPTFPGADTAGFANDAFVFDRQLGTVLLVSVSSDEISGNDQSETPFISQDGTSAIFSSRASNLVAGDTNQAYDVFRRDLVTGTTERIAADDGTIGSAIIASGMSDDGLVAALITRADLIAGDITAMDVYVLDRRTAADLAVTMTDSPDPVAVRGDLTYTVTVQNLGPGDAGSVVLTDLLPAQAVFESATATQGTCTRTGKGNRDGTLVCDLGTINAFGSVTVTIVVSPSSAGVTLTNTATVRANAPDPDAGNSTATETTTVPPK
jgi:uncharacterized repeat protein (TIGR01451 family)